MKKKKLLAYIDRRIEILRKAKQMSRAELDSSYRHMNEFFSTLSWLDGIERDVRKMGTIQQKIETLLDIRDDIITGAYKGDE